MCDQFCGATAVAMKSLNYFWFYWYCFPKDLNLDEYECEEDEFLNPVSKLKIYSPNLHSPSTRDKLPNLLQHSERSKFFSTD